MSGFKDDVISILRINNMLHGEALGWIVGAAQDEKTRELIEYLESRKFPVTGRKDKLVVKYDYIVMRSVKVTARRVIEALSLISNLGIIIMQVDDASQYDDVYNGNKFYSTKVRYDDRDYIVIHAGVDYGN